MILLYLSILACSVAFCNGVGNNTSPNGQTFEATKCFDEQIIQAIDASNIPGASVAVLRRGQIAYEQGYGTRDAPGVGGDDNRPALPSTPFRIASISKAITSWTILRLAQDSLLDLDDVVFGEGGVLEDKLDGHDNIDPMIPTITIRQLLRHSAGFTTRLNASDPTSDPIMSSILISEQLGKPGPATCLDTIDFMLDIPLAYPPDQAASYSNFGYCVLGRVIEGVTNMTYISAVQEWLLDPAGVDQNEMYLGEVQIEKIPEDEAEYFQQGESAACVAPSVYPGDGETLCAYGAAGKGAIDALGGWVATSRQLLKLVAAVAPPHCEPSNSCLLGEVWLEALVQKPPYAWFLPFWIGLGIFVAENKEDTVQDVAQTRQATGGRNVTWVMLGGIPGTAAVVVVDMSEDNGYAYAAIFNGNNVTGLSDNNFNPFEKIAKCVPDNQWPVEYFADDDVGAHNGESDGVGIEEGSGRMIAGFTVNLAIFVAFVIMILKT